jgi:hypothetical protein
MAVMDSVVLLQRTGLPSDWTKVFDMPKDVNELFEKSYLLEEPNPELSLTCQGSTLRSRNTYSQADTCIAVFAPICCYTSIFLLNSQNNVRLNCRVISSKIRLFSAICYKIRQKSAKKNAICCYISAKSM